MSYVGSLIWLVWLLVLSLVAIFYPSLTLIPLTLGNKALFGLTLILLFVYKTFGIALELNKPSNQQFGGVLGISLSVITRNAVIGLNRTDSYDVLQQVYCANFIG